MSQLIDKSNRFTDTPASFDHSLPPQHHRCLVRNPTHSPVHVHWSCTMTSCGQIASSPTLIQMVVDLTFLLVTRIRSNSPHYDDVIVNVDVKKHRQTWSKHLPSCTAVVCQTGLMNLGKLTRQITRLNELSAIHDAGTMSLNMNNTAMVLVIRQWSATK